MSHPIVISLGGSLINPGAIDTQFLKSFSALIARQAERGRVLLLFAAGGDRRGKYQEALRKITVESIIIWIGWGLMRCGRTLIF